MPTRAEHRRRTLRALSDAAVGIMEREGVDVSLERVADEAGVSRRTIYRWVGAREDLVFIHPRLWLEVFDEAVSSSAPAGRGASTLAQRIRTGCAAVCEVVDADPEPVRRAMALAARHPQLLRGAGDVNREWIERLAREVEPEPTDRDARLRARIVAAAVMGAIDAALDEWAGDPSVASLAPVISGALDQVEPMLGSALS